MDLISEIQNFRKDNGDEAITSIKFIGFLKDNQAFQDEEPYVENVLTQIVNGGFIKDILDWKGIDGIKYANNADALANRISVKYATQQDVVLNVIDKISVGVGIINSISKREKSSTSNSSISNSNNLNTNTTASTRKGFFGRLFGPSNNGFKAKDYMTESGDIRSDISELDLLGKLGSIKEFAQNGNPDAQYLLAKIYLLGKGVQKDANEGLKWLNLSANQQHNLSLIALGNEYEKGEIVKQDKQKAIQLYYTPAQNGDAVAQYKIGMYYYGLKNYKEAVNWFEKSSSKRYGHALNMLGECYYFGNGVLQDYKTALIKYTAAANKNILEAKYSLGYMYEMHQGTNGNEKYDEAMAIMCYEEAAKVKHIESFYRRGMIAYNHNEIHLAAKWFEYPAKKGHAKAQCYLGECYIMQPSITGSSKEDHEIAYEWFMKSAKQGNEMAKKELIRWQGYWPKKNIKP